MPAQAVGESCLQWQLGRGATPENARGVHRVYRRLIDAAAAGRLSFRDAVPAYDSIAVYFDPLTTDPGVLQTQIDALIGTPPARGHDDRNEPATTNLFALPTRYDGPDLPHVAAHAGLSVAETIRRHTAPVYVVAAIGFLPHFPYLLGLDPVLTTPRRATPRPQVPAGSVAIGSDQAGVYPQDSPGGWNLIGTTDPAALTALRAGDRVRFENAGPGA